MFVQPNVAEQKRVPQSELSAVHASAAAFRDGAVFAINDRQIELHAEAFVDVVADKRLRDEAVQMLVIGIATIDPARLERVEISILLGEAGEKSLAAVAL